MKRVIFILSTIIFNAVLLSGCWDIKEIDKLAVTKMLSISTADESDDLVIRADISDFSESMDSEKSGEKKSEANIIAGQGKTLSQAFSDLESHYNKKLILYHNKILILSKDYAEKGITNIQDTLQRNPGFRNTTYVIVSDVSPLEIINSKINIEKKSLSGIELLLKSLSKTSHTCSLEWYKFILNLKNDTRVAITPLLNINEASQMSIDSMAVFKDDKMIATLSSEQTKFLQWFLDNIKEQFIDIPFEHDDESSILSLSILRGNCDIKPVKLDDGIQMNINCHAIALLKGITGSNINLQDYHVINKITEQTNNYFENNLEDLVDFSQNYLNADILNFGNKINSVMPITWNNLKTNWDEEFPNIKYNITFNIEFKETGIIKNSIF